MSKKHQKLHNPLEPLKSDAARQRWEMFHRAIAHAKASNTAAMMEAETRQHDQESAGPLLTIVR